mgnify:CR=1 FL=1
MTYRYSHVRISLLACSLLLLAFGCGEITGPNGPNNGQNVSCANPADFSGQIEEDTTLSSGSCYEVSQTVTISKGVLLTIEPGTTIQFQPNTGLNLEGGKLNAEATSDAKIVFTSTEKTPGSWEGIRIHNSNSNDNVLEHIVVEYAGAGGHKSNLFVDDDSGPTRIVIENSVFRHSSGWGVAMEFNNNFHFIESFENNEITENKNAMKMAANDAGELSTSNTFTGNDEDFVDVAGVVGDDQTWPAIDVPYRANKAIRVEEANLTLEAGTTLQFDTGQDLHVGKDASLTASGTSNAKITFTGVDDQPGSWDGITINSTNSADNKLEHVIVENGGGAGDSDANLFIDDDSGSVQITIANSTFRGSKAWGIAFESNNNTHTINGMENNTVTSNANGLKINANDVGEVLGSNSLKGNDNVDVAVAGTVEEDQTWHAVDTSYQITKDVRVEGADMSIEPGVVLEFENGTEFRVQKDASLAAKGTKDEKITFTGTEETKGHWDGLIYQSTTSNDNELDHVVLSYGGGSDGNLFLDDDSAATTITINNSFFENSSKYGLFVEDNNNEPNIEGCKGNSYKGNTEGDVNKNKYGC